MILENIGPSSDTQSYAYFDKGNGFVDQKLNYVMIGSHQIYKRAILAAYVYLVLRQR